MSRKPCLAVKVDLHLYAAVEAACTASGITRSDFLAAAISAAVGEPRAQQMPLPPVAPDQQAGMRLKVLMLLKRGGEWCPEEIGERVGCAASAAGAYCRDQRKPRYGGFNVVGKPGLHQGRRTTYYRWEEK
jgi:hypothetical protein